MILFEIEIYEGLQIITPILNGKPLDERYVFNIGEQAALDFMRLYQINPISAMFAYMVYDEECNGDDYVCEQA